jgi:hypothetical protein
VEVRALDDAEALEAAEPRWLGGELLVAPHAVRAREGVMAKRLARAEEPLVVVLLGGDHDLRDPLVRRGTSSGLPAAAPAKRHRRRTITYWAGVPSARRRGA